MYMINISCDTYKEWDEISYAYAHEWMDDACAHEMQVPNAKLNTGVWQFCEWELVQKVRLLIGSKDSRFGKWSPNWEGPYRIKRCTPGNAYILEALEGEEEFDREINGKFLEKYYPSVWINTWLPICLVIGSNSWY